LWDNGKQQGWGMMAKGSDKGQWEDDWENGSQAA